jgi:hypothetical protein
MQTPDGFETTAGPPCHVTDVDAGDTVPEAGTADVAELGTSTATAAAATAVANGSSQVNLPIYLSFFRPFSGLGEKERAGEYPKNFEMQPDLFLIDSSVN